MKIVLKLSLGISWLALAQTTFSFPGATVVPPQLPTGQSGIQACAANRESLVKRHNVKLKAREYWPAAELLRPCAAVLSDASLRQLIANAEQQSHISTAKNEGLDGATRIQAMDGLTSRYPDVGKRMHDEFAEIRVRIAVSDARKAKSDARRRGVYVGMTKSEVLGSSWGKPRQINITTTADNSREQWVYDGGFLYFENNRLTTIQN